jgi:hypothetical protein
MTTYFLPADSFDPPETVASRILDLHERTGGFGRLLIVSYDAADEREAWERSLRLVIDEVMPVCRASASLGRPIAGARP